jgi:hypothetical protein
VAVLVIDAANVIGSRPNGWWRDRPGAARDFVANVRASVNTGRLIPPVTVVLEGHARAGAVQTTSDGVTVVHAPRDGDDTLVSIIETCEDVTLVTADRALAERGRTFGATVVGPSWLLDQIDG